MIAPQRATAAKLSGGATVGTVVLVGAFFAIGFGQPTLAQNVTVADLFIAVIIMMLGVHILIGDSTAGDVARRLALPWSLIAFGSVLGTMSVGLAPWVINAVIRDAAVALAFLGTIEILRRDGEAAIRAATFGLLAALVVVSAQLLFGTGSALRAGATFPNPNLAGHFLTTSIIAMQGLPIRRGTRLFASTIGLAALLRTASFGAGLQLLVALSALGFWRLRRALIDKPVAFAVILLFALTAGLALLATVPRFLARDTKTTAISSERLDRSAEDRLAKWRTAIGLIDDYPLGVGPGSAEGLKLLPATRSGRHHQETHNEFLAYLVERGIIGFCGLMALLVALWRLAPQQSLSRALLLGFGSALLVRETSHYRHLWLVLALIIVIDQRRLNHAEPQE